MPKTFKEPLYSTPYPYLRKEPKRRRVVKALERALAEFGAERGRLPVQEVKASNLPIIGRE